jgi:F-type H+-transporting ATPase subunit a
MTDPSELFKEVQDATEIVWLGGRAFKIPQPPDWMHFHITRFMLVELLVAVLMILVFVPMARRLRNGDAPRGRLMNFFEALLLFIRDEVARPSIGEHHADRFLPFLWTLFFFVLFGNFMGMVPWIGAPNSSISATAALAVVTLFVVVGAGIKTFGPVGFFIGQVPQIDIPLGLKIFLYPMIFVIEIFGMLVKHCVLAIRLFANIFAGHLVLALILGFIAEVAGTWIWYGVAPASVFGSVALSMLEVLVCLIQAYVITFLAAIFIGMAVHQH